MALSQKQTQWNYLLKGRIKVFLIDNRRDSKTYKRIRSFTINANKERIAYFFPANIGHAYLTYDKENHMIYGTSGYYDKNEEYKIKFDKIDKRIIISKFHHAEKKVL